VQLKTYLGQFELMTILAVLQHGNDAYGGEIQRCLMEQAGRSVTLGAIHRTLQRLEEQGIVNSRLSDGATDRVGRPRRYFTVTGAGIDAVNDFRDTLTCLTAGLNPAFGVK
jgi:PadR family transcriptional regulator PadR